MQVQVRHAFASVYSVVDDEAESVFLQAEVGGDFAGFQK
jgi:hypothetical protein